MLDAPLCSVCYIRTSGLSQETLNQSQRGEKTQQSIWIELAASTWNVLQTASSLRGSTSLWQNATDMSKLHGLGYSLQLVDFTNEVKLNIYYSKQWLYLGPNATFLQTVNDQLAIKVWYDMRVEQWGMEQYVQYFTSLIWQGALSMARRFTYKH